MRTAKLPPAFVVGATNLTVSALTLFPVSQGTGKYFCLSFFLAAARPDSLSFRPKGFSPN